jgi:hypothetical protein
MTLIENGSGNGELSQVVPVSPDSEKSVIISPETTTLRLLIGMQEQSIPGRVIRIHNPKTPDEKEPNKTIRELAPDARFVLGLFARRITCVEQNI